MNVSFDQSHRLEVRKNTLAKRDSLSSTERKEKSASIIDSLIALHSFTQAKTVFSYINFRSEVITKALTDNCFAQNKTLCIPLTVPENSLLVPYQLNHGQKLSPGYCGIPEPDPKTFIKLDPDRIDLIILPGSAFDQQGGRLGYGGGYYDRFAANHAPHALRIGLAFNLQVVDDLPLLPHDQPLHYLITEDHVFNFTKDRQ